MAVQNPSYSSSVIYDFFNSVYRLASKRETIRSLMADQFGMNALELSVELSARPNGHENGIHHYDGPEVARLQPISWSGYYPRIDGKKRGHHSKSSGFKTRLAQEFFSSRKKHRDSVPIKNMGKETTERKIEFRRHQASLSH